MAFSDTTAELALGFGTGTFSVATQDGQQDIRLGNLTPNLDVQVAILKSLAVSLGLTASEVTGLNSNSVLFYGASVSYNFNFGIIYELHREEREVFSVALNVLRPHTLAISPFQAAESAINSYLQNSDPSLVQATANTVWEPQIRGAYAFNPVFGAQADLGLNLNTYSSDVSQPSGSKLLFALGVDTNLNQPLSVPIGFSLAYQRDQILSLGSSNGDFITAGVFTTARKSFTAGLELGKVFVSGINATIGAITIRIYFD